MKKYLDKIKKYFSKHKSFVQKQINPHRHWAFLLSFFMVTIICLIAFSVFLLFQIKNDNFLQGAQKQNTNKSLLNDKLFNRVTKYFDDKAQKMEELKTSSPITPDPSL